jgi:hypothetical protein
MTVTLTWRRLPGATRILSAAPGLLGEIGGCYYLGGGQYRAWASIAGELISAHHTSYPGAMRLLERQLDRRSIGLFGDDDVEFVVVPD